jgi:glycosyltransferase involved in cell wall biosynthesis
MQAAARRQRIFAIEVCGESDIYAWERVDPPGGYEHEVLFPGMNRMQISHAELPARLAEVLGSREWEALALHGWSEPAALHALNWAERNHIPVIMMAEACERDERRTGCKEAIKRRVIKLSSAALVGGRAHAEYLSRLGMPVDRIALGYDAVDNEYFREATSEVRNQRVWLRQRLGLPEEFFLASARFVRKKNLATLLRAFAAYREKAKSRTLKPEFSYSEQAWDLVLLGDGPLKTDLRRIINELSLQDYVHLPGFKQYPDLPAYYGLASVFVHASATEQWGLVVNEAMASGLPVLVSNRCGCAADLVQDAVNGFTFDPYNVEELAALMLRVSEPGFPLAAFGAASGRIIADWGPERFASGLDFAVKCAIAVGSKRANVLDRLLLWALMLR